MNLLGDLRRRPGTYQTDSFVVPEDATGFKVTIDRRHLGNVKRNPDSENTRDRLVAEILAEMSDDGGETWTVIGGVGIEGGDDLIPLRGSFKDATEWTVSPTSWLSKLWPARFQGKRLQVRASWTLHVRCRAKVDVDWRYDPRPPLPTHHSVSITDYDGGEAQSVSSITSASQAATGSNTIAVYVACSSWSSTQTIDDVVRGGSETFDEDLDNTIDGNDWNGAGTFVDPDSSTATTVCTFDGSCQGACGFYMMDGADQDTPVDGTDDDFTNSGTSVLCSPSSSTDGMVVGIGKVYGSSQSLDPTESGQTEDDEFDQPAGGVSNQSICRRTSAGSSTDMGWDWNNSNYGDCCAIAIAPAAAAAGIEVLRRRREEL